MSKRKKATKHRRPRFHFRVASVAFGNLRPFNFARDGIPLQGHLAVGVDRDVIDCYFH